MRRQNHLVALRKIADHLPQLMNRARVKMALGFFYCDHEISSDRG